MSLVVAGTFGSVMPVTARLLCRRVCSGPRCPVGPEVTAAAAAAADRVPGVGRDENEFQISESYPAGFSSRSSTSRRTCKSGVRLQKLIPPPARLPRPFGTDRPSRLGPPSQQGPEEHRGRRSWRSSSSYTRRSRLLLSAWHRTWSSTTHQPLEFHQRQLADPCAAGST